MSSAHPPLEAASVTSSAIEAALVSAPALVADAASDPPSDCVMLRCLRRDFGSQCALLHLLITPEVAMLTRSCATWSRWILEPNLSLCNRRRAVKPSRFAEYLSCEWIRSFVQQLELLPETESLAIDQDGDAEMAARQARETQQLEFALAHIGPGLFPRLDHLEVWLRVPRPSAPVLRDCFASVAARLLTLDCVLPLLAHPIPGDTTAHSLMAHVSLLPRLRRLCIAGAIAAPQSVSFDALPGLAELSEFTFRVCQTDRWLGLRWLASHAQVECLVRCEQLTKLDCGAWDDDVEGEAEPDHACSRMEMLSKAKRPHTGVAGVSSHRALQSLELGSSVISASLWSHLAHLTELDDLWLLGWSWSPSAEEWAPLASFSRLAKLLIEPRHPGWESPVLLSSAFLPALVQCSGLVDLQLSCTALSAAQVQLLTRSLPKLQSLWLVFVRLPLASLVCLASLPLLSNMWLECAPLEGAFENARPHLPALAALTELFMCEPDEHRLTADAVAEQNAALFARCPKLRASDFEQNLL